MAVSTPSFANTTQFTPPTVNKKINPRAPTIRDIKDIDMATSIHPSDIIDLLKQSNIEYDDFAMRYGSIIAYPLDQKVQITTLREDINQIGRHTNVLYTSDWKKDSARRDFTFNAIYLGSDYKLYDYYDGQLDLKEKKIRFIGEIEERIKEDYLRIYRYFRFFGLFDISSYSCKYCLSKASS